MKKLLGRHHMANLLEAVPQQPLHVVWRASRPHIFPTTEVEVVGYWGLTFLPRNGRTPGAKTIKQMVPTAEPFTWCPFRSAMVVCLVRFGADLPCVPMGLIWPPCAEHAKLRSVWITAECLLGVLETPSSQGIIKVPGGLPP